MKATVYIETTIPSLLSARPSRDVEMAWQQIATREWWESRRRDFDLYVSPEVLSEAARGDAEAARLRLEAIADLPVLAVNDDVEALTRRILTTGLIPPRATRDAAHIAFASVYGRPCPQSGYFLKCSVTGWPPAADGCEHGVGIAL